METFSQRIAELRRMTGAPETLRGQVVVDQRYAHYQHERADLHHPRGGRAFYLQSPLYGHFREYLTEYARDVLIDGGHRAMERAMEHLSNAVEVEAPVDFGDLRRSGHPQVQAGERIIYDREPKQHRLTAAELREKSRMTMRDRWNAGKDVFFTRAGKVIHIPAGENRRPW